LASGGNDNFVNIYDYRKPSQALTQYQHEAAVKALDWMKINTLLSGGGTIDRKVKFWKDG
jgi:WD40 repeat protein